jgi:hypothetical protein
VDVATRRITIVNRTTRTAVTTADIVVRSGDSIQRKQKSENGAALLYPTT